MIQHKQLKLAFPTWMRPIIMVFALIAWLPHRLATDPRWQFVLNAFFTIFWATVMLVVPHFRWLYGNTPGLIIEEVSLWANMFTHFGALGGNLAAIIAGKSVPQAAPEEEVTINNIFESDPA
jgi:hypothetical protein